MTREPRGIGRGDRGASSRPSSPAGAGGRIPVAVLGATGIVGQRLVRMLNGHPLFRLAEVAASDRRAGRRYGDAAPWRLPGDPPPAAARLTLRRLSDPVDSRLVLSALPSAAADAVETALAESGHIVCTNASTHRMHSAVPLIVPEVNADAIELVGQQRWFPSGGALVANTNCVVAGIALALAPIHRAIGIRSATVVTLQAISGAGLDGLAAMAISGNVVPWIKGEEEKIAPELNKVLNAYIEVGVAVTRVPVPDGHTAHIFLKLRRQVSLGEVERIWTEYRRPATLGDLPSLPERPLVVRREPDRPQPKLDLRAAGGMGVSVGRIRKAPPPHDIAFVALAHNGVRGAAGACLANAELCATNGLFHIDR